MIKLFQALFGWDDGKVEGQKICVFSTMCVQQRGWKSGGNLDILPPSSFLPMFFIHFRERFVGPWRENSSNTIFLQPYFLLYQTKENENFSLFLPQFLFSLKLIQPNTLLVLTYLSYHLVSLKTKTPYQLKITKTKFKLKPALAFLHTIINSSINQTCPKGLTLYSMISMKTKQF